MKLTGLQRTITINQYFDWATDKSLIQRFIDDNKDYTASLVALDKTNKDCKADLIAYLDTEVRKYAGTEQKENYAALKNGNLLVVKTFSTIMQKHS
ncbi:MAG TPA: hypothetical protein DIT05_04155 [Morganella sp. (in: Bacteria)]|nr:hypothetical protein [Morganella sp. (in: enterobacteria)]